MKDDRGLYASRLQQWFARVSLRARMGIYHEFLSRLEPTAATTILDVGPLVSAAEPVEANVLERTYPYPARLTLLGIHEGQFLEDRYPGVTYVRYTPPAPFPFADQSFDVAYCHAVIEHVGSELARVELLREMRRVARQVFCTTPNRWYVMELHTLLPLVHWLPRRWHRAVLRWLGHTFYADPANLHLLSHRELRQLCADVPGQWQIRPHRFLVGTSNWLLIGTQTSAEPASQRAGE